MGPDVSHILSGASLIFWDFDGVIKDSVALKTIAYEQLFLPYGPDIASRVREHHESHGGISRLDKIPLYLTWVGEAATPARIDEFCGSFSSAVMQAVIDSPWVCGVPEYLRKHYDEQCFVLVTATPQVEIELILAELQLTQYFREVHGAPTKKAHAINATLARFSCLANNALMIGDAETDLEAAKANAVPFLLRRTSLNLPLQATYNGPMFGDLING